MFEYVEELFMDDEETRKKARLREKVKVAEKMALSKSAQKADDYTIDLPMG